MTTLSSPPKKPKLSLQTKVASSGPNVRSSRTLTATVDPSSPTSFNTLSNVYVTAIDRSTPVQQVPPTTAITSRLSPFSPNRDGSHREPRHHAHTPHLGPYLDTPVTAQPQSPQAAKGAVTFPSTMTATPPLSAGAVDPSLTQVFTFSPKDTASRLGPPRAAPPSPRTPYRRANLALSTENPPYTHPRSLHSILRNSPLMTVDTRSPASPTRRSLRLQEKAAKKVAYNSPLEQTITTNKYVRSHIDLLCDDGSPRSPHNADEDPETALDRVMTYTSNETRDGGQTPGPFEEMRRRMTGLAATTPTSQLSPVSSNARKRKRSEKKRRWVWTIGQDEEEDEDGRPLVAEGAPTAPPPKLAPAVPVIAVPAPRSRIGEERVQMPSTACHAALYDSCARGAAQPEWHTPPPPVLGDQTCS